MGVPITAAPRISAAAPSKILAALEFKKYITAV
jgi:hypothetical protein